MEKIKQTIHNTANKVLHRTEGPAREVEEQRQAQPYNTLNTTTPLTTTSTTSTSSSDSDNQPIIGQQRVAGITEGRQLEGQQYIPPAANVTAVGEEAVIPSRTYIYTGERDERERISVPESYTINSAATTQVEQPTLSRDVSDMSISRDVNVTEGVVPQAVPEPMPQRAAVPLQHQQHQYLAVPVELRKGEGEHAEQTYNKIVNNQPL